MRRPSARFFVAFGLASLLASVMLMAMYLDIPDPNNTIRLGRAALAESIAASTSTLVNQSDAARIQAMLAFIVERNPDLQSAAVRKADGETIAIVGDPCAEYWRDRMLDRFADPGPDSRGQPAMGRRRAALQAAGPPAAWDTCAIRGSRWSASSCWLPAVAFYFYLGRVLRQLDPSRAVPRVRAALDTLAEGLLVIDLKGYIVLANQAFAAVVGKAPRS